MRRRLLNALAAVLAAVALSAVVFVVVGPAEAPAQVDEPFEIFRQRLKTFETLYAVVRVPDLRGANHQHQYVLQVSDRKQVSLQSWRRSRSIVWDGKKATIAESQDRNNPRPLPLADQILTDLWSELRSGFATSTVSPLTPGDAALARVDLAYPGSVWRRIELPYPWAKDLGIFVNLTSRDPSRLTDVRLVDLRNSRLLRHQMSDMNLQVTYFRWDVPLDQGAFERLVQRTLTPMDVVPRAFKNVPEHGALHEKCEREGHLHDVLLHLEHTEGQIHGEGPATCAPEVACLTAEDLGWAPPGKGQGQGQGQGNGQGKGKDK